MGWDRFDAVAAALWRELGLPPAPLRRDGSASLTVDGRSVALSPSRDEASVVVTVGLGPLSRDPVAEADQLRRLLRDGCGLVTSRRAAVRVGRGPAPSEGSNVVECQAVAPCRTADVGLLVRAVEDVVFLAEVHAQTLAATAPGGTAMPRLDPADLDGSLIFRL